MSQPYMSLEAELHDAFWDAEDDGSEIDLMGDFLRKFPGPSLEIGCGSGRLLLPLIAEGFQVEGLELSPDMLTLCRQHAATTGIEATLHEGDMSTWTGCGTTYASILAPAFTLQLSSDPEATLRHWHSILRPGAGLYLTLFIPFAELHGDLPEGKWYQDHHALLPDGTRAMLETRHRISHTSQRITREHRYTLYSRPARRHRSSQSLAWFNTDEFREILTRCGFSTIEMFADFDPAAKLDVEAETEFDGIFTCHARRS